MSLNKGKLIVVSGGTKGIGKAILEKFAADGFDIVTCSRSASNLAELKNDLLARYPNILFHALEADMSLEADAKAFGDFVCSLNRPVDVLVNNAGLFVPGSIHNEPEGNLDFMMRVNLMSAYYLTRALVEDMKKRKSGHIFFLNSVASTQAYPNGGSYSVSKFALHGFCKAIREELKTFGVRVTSLMPGATYTASWEASGLHPERFMKASDVAAMVYQTWAISHQAVVEEILMRPQLGDI
jgi:short-subunit dehydrogenase